MVVELAVQNVLLLSPIVNLLVCYRLHHPRQLQRHLIIQNLSVLVVLLAAWALGVLVWAHATTLWVERAAWLAVG